MQSSLFAAVFASCEHDSGWNMQLIFPMLQHAAWDEDGTEPACHAKCCITDNVTYTCRLIAL